MHEKFKSDYDSPDQQVFLPILAGALKLFQNYIQITISFIAFDLDFTIFYIFKMHLNTKCIH